MSSALQSLTARQDGPSIEGPEGPRPTAMLIGKGALIERGSAYREGVHIFVIVPCRRSRF